MFMKFDLKIFIYILIAISLISCNRAGDIAQQAIDRASGPDSIIFGVEMTQITGGNIEWVMRSDIIHRFTSEQRWVAFNVFLETVGEEDKSFFEADSTFVNDFDDIIIGMGNVVITSPNGIMRTEKIIWNRMNDHIQAPGRAVIIRGGNEFRGFELFTNSGLTYINMRSVSGEGTLEDF